jgi:hypothetical protein
MMRGTTATLTMLGMAALLLAGCDDSGRLETVPGAAPTEEVPPADATWDTLHPPVLPARDPNGQVSVAQRTR